MGCLLIYITRLILPAPNALSFAHVAVVHSVFLDNISQVNATEV